MNLLQIVLRTPIDIAVNSLPIAMTYMIGEQIDTPIPIRSIKSAANNPNLLPFTKNDPPKMLPIARPMGIVVKSREFTRVLFSIPTTNGIISLRKLYDAGTNPQSTIPRLIERSQKNK